MGDVETHGISGVWPAVLIVECLVAEGRNVVEPNKILAPFSHALSTGELFAVPAYSVRLVNRPCMT